MPGPALMKLPVLEAAAPEMVRTVAALETLIDEVVPLTRVKLRLVEAVAPVYCRVPPLVSHRLPAALVAAPRLLATPPLPMVATLSTPPLKVVTPV